MRSQYGPVFMECGDFPCVSLFSVVNELALSITTEIQLEYMKKQTPDPLSGPSRVIDR